jgi:RNA polymerase sigma-70 factor, ECF subfamily
LQLASQISSTETEIVALLQSGNQRAIDIIYDKYGDALYGLLCKILNNDVQAEDALQISLVKIWKNAASYDASKGRLFTWMLNIARNTALDMLKSKENKNQKQNRNVEDVVSIIDSNSDNKLNIDTIGLKKVISALPADQQQIIDLMYFQGFTQAEIAEYIPMALGTVKTKLRNAIIALRKIFNN